MKKEIKIILPFGIKYFNCKTSIIFDNRTACCSYSKSLKVLRQILGLTTNIEKAKCLLCCVCQVLFGIFRIHGFFQC